MINRRRFVRQLATVAGAAAAGTFAGCATPGTRADRLSSVRPPVRNGIDVLVAQNFAPLKGLRIGLITNHTGHDRQRRATIDLLNGAPGVKLAALFGPEHGVRGELDEKFKDSVDERTGLKVFSLYGERRHPTPEQLQGLDALVFDIQDIGCRFYTYPSTMGLCMEAAAKAKLKFFVLDRVNPINGVALEGPLHHGKRAFVAFHPVPLRHGMTVGELARMYSAEQKFGADLTVIPCEGWRRAMWFDHTGLPWTNQSPNMRSLPGATLYPGLGLHEKALCVGRGTDKPFELVAAPYVDDVRLARELNGLGLAGWRCMPIRVTPSYSTFKDQPCGGVAFVIHDRNRVNAVSAGLAVATTLQRLYPGQFELQKLHTLLQHPQTLDGIRAGKSLDELQGVWRDELAAFAKRRRPFLIYS